MHPLLLYHLTTISRGLQEENLGKSYEASYIKWLQWWTDTWSQTFTGQEPVWKWNERTDQGSFIFSIFFLCTDCSSYILDYYILKRWVCGVFFLSLFRHHGEFIKTGVEQRKKGMSGFKSLFYHDLAAEYLLRFFLLHHILGN